MLKNIVSKFSDRGKEQPTSSESCDINKVPEGFLCPTCLGSFGNQELLQSHYQIHHEETQPSSPGAVTLQNSSAFYDDSAVEFEVEANGGSCVPVSPEADVTLLMDENELRKRLAAVIQSNGLKEQKIKMLESQANQLTQEYSNLKVYSDKEKTVQNALQERIKVLEAQLTQRASLDDATALRHGLIQVQQAMDQMALERERERDEYKEKLQRLQDTMNQETEHAVHDREKLLKVLEEYQQLQVKLKIFLQRIVNAQQLINTNQFSSYEQALRRVKIQLEWLKSASKDAIIINFRELKELKALLAKGNKEMCVEQALDEDLEPDFSTFEVGSVITSPEEFQFLQEDSESVKLPVKQEESTNENSEESRKLYEQEERMLVLQKEINALQYRNKELERESVRQHEDVGRMKNKISDSEGKLKQLGSQLLHSSNEEALLKITMEKLQQEKNALEHQTKELEKEHAHQCEEIGRMKDKISDLENKLKLSGSELSRSRQEEHSLTISLAELQKDKSSLEEEIRVLQEKYTTQEEQMRYLGVQRTSLETSLFELQKSFTNLELEKASVKKSLDEEIVQLNEEKSQLEHKLDEVTGTKAETLQRLVAQEDAHKLMLETFENEKQALESNYKNLEHKVQLEDEVKHDLKRQMDHLKNKTANLESQLEELKISHQQDLDELKAAMETKQAALDDVAGEKLALEAQVETLQMEQKALLERCYASTAEAEQLRRTHVEACRSQEEVQAALQELGRENQTLQMKMDKLLGRKWAEDSEVTNCTKCEKEFSLIVRKHHCRNCFKIFCNECSSRVTAIEMDKKPVRVCDSCYSELAHK